MKERILWLDFLRTVGLMLVVLGHTQYVPADMKGVIYTFHMPLFFFLSGYLWTDGNIERYSFVAFAKKKFKAFIIPYFKVAGVCLLVWGVITPPLLKNFNFQEWIELNLNFICGTLYSIGDVWHMPNCSPIWFLTSLYCANLIFYLIRRWRLHIVTAVLVLALGYVLTIPEHVVWNIGSATTGSVFMWIGFEVKRNDKFKFGMKEIAILAITIAVIYVAWGIPFASMDGHKYSNYPLFIVLASAECLLLIGLARDWLSPYLSAISKPVNFIALNSIAVFGYNYAANSLACKASFLWNGYWPVTFVAVTTLIVTFILVIKRLRMERLFV